MKTAVVHTPAASYPSRPPYDPPRRFPETRGTGGIDPDNTVYPAVRDALHLAGCDTARFDTPQWNPLGHCIRPGNTVFVKPNMIAHKHKLNDDWEYVITHGSVIRAVVDYAVIALEGQGRILIGDGPQTDSLWDNIVARMGLAEIAAACAAKPGLTIELVDLRDEHWITKDGIYVERVKLPGDPNGKVAFDLGRQSMLAELDGRGKRYYGAYYDVDETNRHHGDGRHEYMLSRSPLVADVLINVPKLKTHKKCGLTVNLKSLVGINADKNWLPHYAIGSPETGGDQFDRPQAKARLENSLVLAAKRYLSRGNRLVQFLARRAMQLGYRVFGDTESVVRSGNWHGNDTVWRMCLDLNRILLYGEPDGTLRTNGRRKRFFSIVDGIAAMEGDGPVAGQRKHAGVVLAGDDPVVVDAVCARLMGFDWQRLPLIARAFDAHPLPLTDMPYAEIESAGNRPEWNGRLENWPEDAGFDFAPHFGWTGHVERSRGKTDGC